MTCGNNLAVHILAGSEVEMVFKDAAKVCCGWKEKGRRCQS